MSFLWSRADDSAKQDPWFEKAHSSGKPLINIAPTNFHENEILDPLPPNLTLVRYKFYCYCSFIAAVLFYNYKDVLVPDCLQMKHYISALNFRIGCLFTFTQSKLKLKYYHILHKHKFILPCSIWTMSKKNKIWGVPKT